MNRLTAMRQGGAILGRVREALFHFTKVGVSPKDIEAESRRLISRLGAEPSFTKVPGYHWSTCVNLNSGIVHGIPESAEPFHDGDLVTVDVGVFYQGYHTDCAFSKVVGKSTARLDKFIQAGLDSIEASLSAVKAGNRIGDISASTERSFAKSGVHYTRELTGHGVGRELHEEPMIPNYLSRKIADTPQMVVGQTLAIENIYCEGKSALVMGSDGWTISVKDGKLSAVFEETVEVTADGFSILTNPSLFQIFQSGTMHQ